MKRTFANQDNLPKIPIPKLNDTCNRFIEWVQPLLTEEEFLKTKKMVEKFKSKDGDGKKLQEELIRWAERNNLSNWTAPLWENLYLASRNPLIIEGNVFYIIKNKLKDLGVTQEYMATALILSVCRFKGLIDREELDVDLQEDRPICMLQYKRLFSATRIPRREKDLLKITPSQKYIVVLYKGQIFILDVLLDSGDMRSFVEIQEDLKYIINISKRREGEGLGILTTMNRDEWADTRKSLLKIDETNKENIEKIENAIFALCLDDESPNSLEEASNMMLHGNGKNRWFDKSLQFIVAKNGELGINMEHTGIDGSVMARFTEWIYEDMDKIHTHEKKYLQNRPEKLTFHLNDPLKKQISKAFNQFNEVVSNTETRVFHFDQFGKKLIKTFGISPDAFVQLALQLAQYKLYGRCYSVYEAVMTRKFLAGRIEVMYCVSMESIEFIKNMISDCCDHNKKAASLKKAAQKHVERIKECKNGRGIDGHLLGLLNMYDSFDKEIGVDTLPQIFTDKGYVTLTHSTICTSTSSIKGLKLAGYGPVVEDGFGIRYLKENDYICFNITSRTYMKEKLNRLVLNIEESLIEMAKIMKLLS
ncbi:choline/carnitine O-acyltransferase [Inediibacterium massiliense]|uniref:choline/carnitine O-acyltransferase n=1 Tax=Inediibacterium massiliense TaxID=1658111 RepID=UPI0006B40C5D|nr:choline/carnitine O-acyltransferase [Inediibacterium massiliense]